MTKAMSERKGTMSEMISNSIEQHGAEGAEGARKVGARDDEQKDKPHVKEARAIEPAARPHRTARPLSGQAASYHHPTHGSAGTAEGSAPRAEGVLGARMLAKLTNSAPTQSTLVGRTTGPRAAPAGRTAS
eukprot:5449942-Prymnesium_polylepis.1